MCQPFVIIKPEAFRFLKEIETEIVGCGYLIDALYHIPSWGALSSKIYKYDWDNNFSSPLDFLAHTWICNYFFGDNAILALISFRKTQNPAEIGFKVKKSFRRKYTKKMDFITLTINLEKIRFINEGDLILKENKEIDSFKFFNHNKMIPESDFRRKTSFTHIHSPDPKIEALTREWNLIIDEKIICEENSISGKAWTFMKKVNCISHPSELERNEKS